MRHFLEVDDLDAGELADVLDLAQSPHQHRHPSPPQQHSYPSPPHQHSHPQLLAGQGVALVFEKPSLRTRNSTEMAVVQLGGHPAYILPDEVGLDERESVEDATRTLACYHAVVGARVFAHSTVERMASVNAVPVINLLSDDAHPMQALADVLTLRAVLGPLPGRAVAYVGDANNVARSLTLAAAMSGMGVRIASPAGYGFDEASLARLRAAGCEPETTESPAEAVSGADAVYTDVWASMGQESEASERRRAFRGYTVDEALMALAAPGAVFLHCLPAHRGEEVAAEVIDGPCSRVWLQAANRMHAARGLLQWLLTSS